MSEIQKMVDLYRRGWSTTAIGEIFDTPPGTVHGRLRRHGVEFRDRGPTPKPPVDRVMEQVEINPRTECWVFTGYRGGDGYGRISMTGGRGATPALVHRIVYEALVSEIPEHMCIDHLCCIRACVNPRHLEAVTPQENVARGTGRSGRFYHTRKD